MLPPASFTKVSLGAGEHRVVTVTVRLCDLARYDEDATTTNRKGKPVVGAYVVDGGTYGFYAGDCVASGGVYNDVATCPHNTAKEGVQATIGRPDTVYGVYL